MFKVHLYGSKEDISRGVHSAYHNSRETRAAVPCVQGAKKTPLKPRNPEPFMMRAGRTEVAVNRELRIRDSTWAGAALFRRQGAGGA